MTMFMPVIKNASPELGELLEVLLKGGQGIEDMKENSTFLQGALGQLKNTEIPVHLIGCNATSYLGDERIQGLAMVIPLLGLAKHKLHDLLIPAPSQLAAKAGLSNTLITRKANIKATHFPILGAETSGLDHPEVIASIKDFIIAKIPTAAAK